MPRIRRIAADLVGVHEPIFDPEPAIGGRQARSEAIGLTSSAAANHLWRFGEFLATYLLYWSDTLWPAVLPEWAQVQPGDVDPSVDEDGWNAQRQNTETFRRGIADARKVLATVPTLMILDDHEVTPVCQGELRPTVHSKSV